SARVLSSMAFGPENQVRTRLTAGGGSHERTRLSPIPCYTGKIQGISLALASCTRIWCLNPHNNQRLTSKFPTQRNRELNGPYQGIKSAQQGSVPPDQGRGAPQGLCGILGGSAGTTQERH